MSKRPAIPKTTETELFTKSGRRWAICYTLHGDTKVKAGQIAHLDDNPRNNNLQQFPLAVMNASARVLFSPFVSLETSFPSGPPISTAK